MIQALTRSTAGLAIAISALFALATLLIGFVMFNVTHEALEKQLDHRIALEAHALMSEPGGAREAPLAAAIRRREAARGPSSLEYLLVDRAGRHVAGGLAARAPEQAGYVELLPVGGGRVAQSLTTVLPEGGRLVVAADRTIIDEMDETVARVFGAGLIAMLVLGAAGAWTIGALTRRRLSRIDRAAAAIADGDLSTRVPLDGSGSEFERVSATLNRMLDRIEALMTNLRQVSTDVAHDLRTPLTRLRNRLEEAAAGLPEGRSREAIAAATEQADELLEIFSALLRISEVEAFGVREHFRLIPLDLLIAELLERYEPDAEASGHRLETRVEADVIIEGDRRLLQQMLSNLLDNALRHTPPATTVSVTLTKSSDAATLTVSDNGPGVPAEDRPRLFQRFARSERSRSSDEHGLGLALVAAIAQAHRGKVELAPDPGFGVTVTMLREDLAR